MDSDDIDLLRRWRSGDRRAGETLACRHYRAIFHHLRRKLGGDADLAADLTQRVFKVAVANRDDIVTDFRRYLFGTARLKLREHRRRRRPDGDDPLSRLVDPARGAFSIIATTEDGKLLVWALRSLTVEEQSYLMWYYADRLTQSEIAARVGLTAAQVNGRIHRAKEKVRRKLEELGRSPLVLASIEKSFEGWLISLRRKVQGGEKDGSN